MIFGGGVNFSTWHSLSGYGRCDDPFKKTKGAKEVKNFVPTLQGAQLVAKPLTGLVAVPMSASLSLEIFEFFTRKKKPSRNYSGWPSFEFVWKIIVTQIL